MIPSFPNFKQLDIHDRHEVEEYVARFPPYSDFNFVSLLTYDVSNSVKVSFLNGNLAVSMNDYLTQERFYTFIGTGNVRETAVSLLELSGSASDLPRLRLVPEDAIGAMNGSGTVHFRIAPDPASFDYIHSVADLIELGSSDLASKRQSIRSFQRSYPRCATTILDLGDQECIEGMRGVMQAWRKARTRTEEEVAVEFSAIDRCLALGTVLGLVAVGAWLDEQLVGFTVNELLPDGFYMGHFGKALPSCRGLSDFLEHDTAKIMQSLGCDRMNNQQDLGLPGLRKAKRSWRPVSFLEKFTVELRS